MKIFRGNFDHLHFTECFLVELSINETFTEIVIDGLVLLNSHPAFSIFGNKCPRAVLRWSSVHEFFIKTSPYIGNPEQGVFGISNVENFIFSDKTNRSRNYDLEGILINNPAWCDITINADDFGLLL